MWVSAIQETDSRPWRIGLSKVHLLSLASAPPPPPTPPPQIEPLRALFSLIQGLLGPRSVLTKALIDVSISVSLEMPREAVGCKC